MAIDRRTWLDSYASLLGVDRLPDNDVDCLLELASVAARSSERSAAPLSCWLAATSAQTPQQALELARQLAESVPDTSEA